MTKQHGGKREGAGRKYKYGCKTVLVRIPIDLQKDIMSMLERLEQENRTQKNDISGNSI